MKIKQLEERLDEMGISKSSYSINSDLSTDTFILNEIYGKWEYFYFDEKGNKLGYKTFETEDEACEYLIKVCEAEIKYPPLLNKRI